MNGDIRISVNFVQHAKTPEEWRQFKANSMRKWGGE